MFSPSCERPVRSFPALIFFRLAFGLMMAASVLRFFLKGWIASLYIVPSYHFPYAGFAWVKPWHHYAILGQSLPSWSMYAHFALMFAAALMVAFGYAYRFAIVSFFLLFTFVELIDKTTYLNHYYLISLLSLLMIFMPLSPSRRHASPRSSPRRCHRSQRRGFPVLSPGSALVLLRAQIGVVYVFAGLAKLKGDWLLRGEPLFTWLHTYDHLPLVGPLLTTRECAIAMSWAGMIFDLSVVPLLLFRRTRLFAYLMLGLFHLITAYLFHIGMFPWVMMVVTTVFFAPDWPATLRRTAALWWARVRGREHALGGTRHDLATRRIAPAFAPEGAAAPHRWLSWMVFVYCAVQLFLPLRQHLYAGNPCWTEQGYRFAWNVMLMEKTGQVTFRVRNPRNGRVWVIHPRESLSAFQQRMLPTQPDMIVDYARRLAERFARDGVRKVEVRADAFASLNGRRSQRLIDPQVNLLAARSGFAPATFIYALDAIPPGR